MNCWHQSYILSLWTEEKRGSAGRGVYHERSKEVNLFQIYNMDSGNVVGLSCRSEWIILSTEVNLCLLGKRIASSKFCLGRTCISITMKFINEVVNGRVTIIRFVVTNLVCVPKKRNLSIFRGLKGAWKRIRTLEWKRDVTPVPSESVVNPISDRGSWQLNPILTIIFISVIVRKEGPAPSCSRIVALSFSTLWLRISQFYFSMGRGRDITQR